jgi:hypothetical protein
MSFFGIDERIKVTRSPDSPPEHAQELILENGEKISVGGEYARKGIYQAQAVFANDPEQTKVPVVVKQYTVRDAELFKRFIDTVSATHKKMREEGFRVPRTLRFDMTHYLTLMTDFNAEGRVAVSPQHTSEKITPKSLKEVPGFEEMVRTVYSEAIRAGSKGFYIPFDSYFVLVPTEEGKMTDFVYGDLDTLWQRGEGDYTKKDDLIVIRKNINDAVKFLKKFCEKFVAPRAYTHYKELVFTLANEAWNEEKRQQYLQG